jgi:hypothetical protein
LTARIDRGAIEATHALEWVPQEAWPGLVQARRAFLAVTLPHDCRALIQFAAEAARMWRPLGYASREEFIAVGLGLVPEDVDWAVVGLQRWKPDEPIPLADAVHLGKRGRPRKGEERKGTEIPLRGGNPTYIIARLDRDRPELAARVRTGDLTAYAAARQAGIAKRTFRVPLDDSAAAVRAILKHYTAADIRRALDGTVA